MTEEIIERIERYLSGELSEAEHISFEKEMQINNSLQKQVEFMRLLPKAIQIHSLKKELKEIEAKLPRVEFVPEEKEVEADYVIGAKRSISEELSQVAEPMSEYPKPKSISRSLWIRYAVAASVLLLVGIFLFRDEIFKSRINQNQFAENKADSLKQEKQKNVLPEKQVAVVNLTITKIEDSKFGFVKNQLERKIVVVQETDSAAIRAFALGKTGNTIQDGLYLLVQDTLYVNTGVLEKSIQVFDFDIKAQTGDSINSVGEMVHYQKPPIQGLYLLRSIHFYKIMKTQSYKPLVPVEKSELELLKSYASK
jgi:hypothetical protein